MSQCGGCTYYILDCVFHHKDSEVSWLAIIGIEFLCKLSVVCVYYTVESFVLLPNLSMCKCLRPSFLFPLSTCASESYGI